MSKYSVDLLDGWELLYKRTDITLDSTIEMSKFFRKLSEVTQDYARSLGKLAKTAQKTSKSVDQEIGTLKTAWDVLLVQLDSIADQHNKFAANTINEVSTNIANWQRDKEKDRKKISI